MIYTDLTKAAMKLRYTAHHGQVDKSGIPYVFHPIHLAEQMQDELTTVTALLHDVIEDTDYSLEDLQEMGYPTEVLDALKLLTHDPQVPYLEYIEAIKKNPIARAVKLADLQHNSDLTRLNEQNNNDLVRVQKYSQAQNELQHNVRKRIRECSIAWQLRI